MLKYVIEVGLDAISQPGSDGSFPMLVSLVKVDEPETGPGTPELAWLASLDHEIPFVIRIFNYSPTGHGFTQRPIGIMATLLYSYVSGSVVPVTPESPIICGKESLFNPNRTSYLRPTLNPQCWGLRTNGVGPLVEEQLFHFPDSDDTRAVLDISVYALNELEPPKNPEFRIFRQDPEIFIGEG